MIDYKVAAGLAFLTKLAGRANVTYANASQRVEEA